MDSANTRKQKILHSIINRTKHIECYFPLIMFCNAEKLQNPSFLQRSFELNEIKGLDVAKPCCKMSL